MRSIFSYMACEQLNTSSTSTIVDRASLAALIMGASTWHITHHGHARVSQLRALQSSASLGSRFWINPSEHLSYDYTLPSLQFAILDAKVCHADLQLSTDSAKRVHRWSEPATCVNK